MSAPGLQAVWRAASVGSAVALAASVLAPASAAVPPDLERFPSKAALSIRLPEARFLSGGFPWLDPDSVLLPPAAPLQLYQAVFPPRTIHATKDGVTVRLESWIEVPVQAVQLSDDDGSRPANITPDQVRDWVDEVNQLWRGAALRLLYDPTLDFSTHRSTLLNDMGSGTSFPWDAQALAGNALAAQFPGRVLLLFRHGPGAFPTGGAFSGWELDFVAMTGFFDTWVCGQQNIGLMAHELGHYFGLAHTFAQVFATVADAETYLSAAGNDPAVFDGDGLADTPPDPMVNDPGLQCTPPPTLTLNGIDLTLPRDSIMSYYAGSTGLSRQQTTLAYWLLDWRLRNGMAGASNRLAPPAAIELDSLPVVSVAGLTYGWQDMHGFSWVKWHEDDHLWVGASSGAHIELRLAVAASGRYRMDAYLTRAPDFSQVQVSIDGVPIGAQIDLFAPIVCPTGAVTLGVANLAAGDHLLRFTVTGLNPDSTGHGMGLDCLMLVP